MEEIIIHLLGLLSAAVMAVQIAYDSVLAQRIKAFLFSYDLSKAKKWETYYVRMTEVWFVLLTPVWFLIWVYAVVYEFVKELINCCYCTSYHLGWMVLYFMFDYTLIESLLFGAIAIFFVEIYRKLSL